MWRRSWRTASSFLRLNGWVGGWVGGWVVERIEEDEAVGMRCCGDHMGGWVGGWEGGLPDGVGDVSCCFKHVAGPEHSHELLFVCDHYSVGRERVGGRLRFCLMNWVGG